MTLLMFSQKTVQKQLLLTRRKKRHEIWALMLRSSRTEAPLASWQTRQVLEGGGRVHILKAHGHTNTADQLVSHLVPVQQVFFSFSSTPTTGSSLFKIMKPQREPAGLCRSIWRRHRWLPGRTLDPSNWLRRQHEMDKWEAPPEWPDGWGRNEEACLVSHESFSVTCFVFPSLGWSVSMHQFWSH